MRKVASEWDSLNPYPEDTISYDEDNLFNREIAVDLGLVGMLKQQAVRPGGVSRGLAGEDSWKRLLPEDYNFETDYSEIF